PTAGAVAGPGRLRHGAQTNNPHLADDSSEARPHNVCMGTATDPGTHEDRAVVRRIAALMAFVAVTLVVASVLHLSGSVHGRSSPFNGEHAGIAEALIGAVLAGGAITMLRTPGAARTIGLATTAFAVVGFLIGLSFTVRGGYLPDISYHLVM